MVGLIIIMCVRMLVLVRGEPTYLIKLHILQLESRGFPSARFQTPAFSYSFGYG